MILAEPISAEIPHSDSNLTINSAWKMYSNAAGVWLETNQGTPPGKYRVAQQNKQSRVRPTAESITKHHNNDTTRSVTQCYIDKPLSIT